MHARIVESSLEKTARLLSGQHGVTVRFKPDTALTDGRQIILPTIPPNADQHLLDAMQGYLNHEVGHVIFSDFDEIVAAKKESAILGVVQNFVEDVRIEREFEKMYPGSKSNFYSLVCVTFAKLKEAWDKQQPWFRILCAAYLQARHPGTRFWSEVVEDEERQAASSIVSMLDTEPLDSTKDATELARKIIQQLQLPEVSEGMTLQEVVVVLMGGGESVPPPSGETPEAMDAVSGANGASIGDASGLVLVSHIKDVYTHDLGGARAYTPYDTSSDTIQSTPDHWNLGEMTRLRSHAEEYVSIMRRRLVALLRSRLRARWVGGKEQGRLDSRKLYKAMHGATAVYKEKVHSHRMDTAVALMIDQSGSMQGYRLQLAKEAAIVMGDVLSKINVPFMVAGHSTDSPHHVPASADIYSRYNHLWISQHVGWNDNWSSASHKLLSLAPRNNTLDGEALRWTAQQLLARPEQRKVLFWFSDGFPQPGYGDVADCQEYLKQMARSCEAHGIEVIAFGIQSEAVKYYFKKYVIINQLEDLVREPLSHLDRILREGIK